MSNNGAQNLTPKGPCPPKRDQKGKCLRHGHRVYHTATKMYPNRSVHSRPTTYASNISPNSGLFTPFGGINPQKRGNDWPCDAHYCQIPLAFLFHILWTSRMADLPPTLCRCRKCLVCKQHRVSEF